MSLLILLANSPFILPSDMMHESILEENIKQARQQLMDYGLIHCLNDIDPQESKLKSDLTHYAGAFHYFTNGRHKIIQNEETFENTHDPYRVIADYFTKNKVAHLNTYKHHAIVESSACFKIYHSQEFKELIDSQDQYID